MQFDLANPKNDLQYQLYKITLILEQIVNQVAPLLSKITESFVKNVVDPYLEYQRLQELGAKANPKIAYLAYHVKTQRARIKNQRRLYKLGKKINGGE